MKTVAAMTALAVSLTSLQPSFAAPKKNQRAAKAPKSVKTAVPAAPSLPPPSVALTIGFVSPKRWTMRLENTGDLPVRIVADPALLSFELSGGTPVATAPAPKAKGKGKALAKKPSGPPRCSLPADMRPSNDVDRGLLLLPGKAYKESFDPRLYCFDARASEAILPGARVLARYGFDASRTAGPFVVSPIPMADALATHSPLREIVAAPVEITADAAGSPQESLANVPPAAPLPPEGLGARLAVSMPPRVDGARASELLTTVTLTNVGTRATAVYFRPQTLAFDVIGPAGESTCPAAGASAIRELFTTLGPQGKSQVGLLLAASCPWTTFDVPGLYEVRVKLDTRKVAGSPETLHAFDGEVKATSSSLIRVRAGRPGAPKPPAMVE